MRDKLFRKWKRSWLGAAKVDSMQLGEGGLVYGWFAVPNVGRHSNTTVVRGSDYASNKKRDNATQQKMECFKKGWGKQL